MGHLPNLKRITINSELALDIWLKKNSTVSEAVILVTHTKETHRKFISSEQVRRQLEKHHWTSGSSYTIGSDLLGRVVQKAKQ